MMRRTLSALAAVLISAPLAAATTHPGPLGPGEWWYAQMGVDELHEHGTGQGIVVAIIDTPLDPSVPELEGVEVLSSEGFCLLDGQPRPSRETGPEAEHATGMAVLIAGNGRGTGPGGAGVRGIAPDVQLRHYAVMYNEGEGQESMEGGGQVCNLGGVDWAVSRSAPAAIIEAARDGADIINLSLSTGANVGYTEAILTAHEHNAILVTGTAGDTYGWPARSNGVLAVNPVRQDRGISEKAGGMARSHVRTDLAAPGEDIAGGGFPGGAWDSAMVSSGSSNSTAIVSGGLAAIWSAHPSATANQIIQAAITYTGVRPGDEDGSWKHDFRRAPHAPTAAAKSQRHGYGIFAPADAVLIDPTTLPDEMPLFRTDVDESPPIEEIREALARRAPDDSPAVRLGLVAGEEATATDPAQATSDSTEATDRTATPDSTGTSADAATDADAEQDSGTVAQVLWLAGAAALAGVLLLGVLARRRRQPAAVPRTTEAPTHDPAPHDQGGTPR